jgi:hypothetical protein
LISTTAGVAAIERGVSDASTPRQTGTATTMNIVVGGKLAQANSFNAAISGRPITGYGWCLETSNVPKAAENLTSLQDLGRSLRTTAAMTSPLPGR